jgi:hypothetical protein
MKEEFLISFRAGQSARPHAFHAQPGGLCRRAHARDRAFVERRLSHDSPAAHISAVKLKLRLHKD